MSEAECSTQEKYDRNARTYDLMELLPESLLFRRYRRMLFSQITGETLLDVGVGTGKDIPYYPRGMTVTAIDFSEQMLRRARERARRLHASLDLRVMDIESLRFDDNSFDAVAAAFVFCSVPDPMKGLAEVRRVLKPEGRFYALEHVRPTGRFLRRIFDYLAPAVVARTGVHINRETVTNIRNAGFQVELDRNLLWDVFRIIVARPAK